MIIKLRRGTSAEWAAANTVLALGEPGWDTTEDMIKFGDGVTPWSYLPFYGGIGPRGAVGPNAIVVGDDGGYNVDQIPEESVLFTGPLNPDDLGIMRDGDSWINTSEAAPDTFEWMSAESFLTKLGSPSDPLTLQLRSMFVGQYPTANRPAASAYANRILWDTDDMSFYASDGSNWTELSFGSTISEVQGLQAALNAKVGGDGSVTSIEYHETLPSAGQAGRLVLVPAS